ncbi:sugar nucleotide-binding protein, partial [Candidatus Microgenomates bacterium]|nr:sugar nucleotide-binding protein [Candidatus Microgenomates bacterium]
MNNVFLVTGGSGLVGSNVAWVNRSDYDVIITWKNNPVNMQGCRSEKLDILNKDECIKIIKKYKPDYVIHTAAANWSFDECEQDTRGLSKDGICGATQSIVEACHLANSKLVFFSTDWVFDGTKPLGEKYDEEDLAKPICKYGQYKYETEKYI